MKPNAAVVLGVTWLVAFNLRSGFIGIGAVLPRLTDALRLSHTEASLLVALPTAMMGFGAIPGGAWADRWGAPRVITVGLVLVAAGGLRGTASSFVVLLLLSVAFGAGLGIAQPALPRLARAWFPNKIGTATGLYASGFVSGSIVGASLSGTLLLSLSADRDWGVPIAIWGGVAGLTLLVWMVTLRPWRVDETVAARDATRHAAPGARAWSPWRHRGVWIVAILFALQGLAYYLLIAWLPAVYEDLGLGTGHASALFATFNGATLPAILGFPILSDRLGSRRPAALVASLLFLIGAVGLVVAPLTWGGQWLWPALAGAGVAGVFAVTLVLPADVAPPGQTGVAAGMVLGIGYAGSALGPIIAGIGRDVTGSFASALALLPVVGVIMVGLSLTVPELPRGRATHHDNAISQREAEA